MGILSKIINISKKTTKGFYFGHTEAEGENKVGIQNLGHYFEDYLEIIPQIANEKFIFLGRKGSGKSAIAKFIKDSSEKENDSYCELIKYSEVELEKIIQAVEESKKEELEIFIFEWLILIRLIKLCVKNKDAIFTAEHKKLEKFLKTNSGFVEIDKYSITEIIDRKKLELSIDVLKHIAPITLGKYIDIKSSKALFYNFVLPLKEILKNILNYEVHKSKEYFVLFDDLDIKFKVNDEKSKHKILNLLRAAKNLNTTTFIGTGARVLVFLRDDIKKSIESLDSDSSKLLSGYSILINWYDHKNYRLGENQINLKKFANKRIALNFDANKLNYDRNEPWSSLFQEDPISFKSKTSFKYVLDFTFYRPRDIVLFLSEIGKEDYHFPLDANCVKVILQKYIVENIQEIKSELIIYLSERDVESLFKVLKELTFTSRNFTKDAIKTKLEPCFEIQSEQIIELLINYSLLIHIDNENNLHFIYRENFAGGKNTEAMKLTFHKCLYYYFNPSELN